MIGNKNELSDESCLDSLRQGDASMMEVLMERYKNLVRVKAGTLFIIGGDEQDLIQEGMIGLLKAIRDYDFGRDASFYTFADLCVTRQMYNAIQASGRLKNIPLNDYISFYAKGGGAEDEDSKPLMDTLVADNNMEPEKQILDAEAAEEIITLIEESLSLIEKDVFVLHLTGMPTSEIAAVLGTEPKSADNALQRAKMKLRKEIQK